MSEHVAGMSDEVTEIWSFLNETIERMLAVAGELSDQELHWSPLDQGSNSVAVLLTHTMGSLEETIVQVLAGEEVGRDRDAEFVERGVTAAVLADQWAGHRARLEPVFAAVNSGQLSAVHTHPRRGDVTGRNVLLGALTHAREHLGHAELTRDLIIANR